MKRIRVLFSLLLLLIITFICGCEGGETIINDTNTYEIYYSEGQVFEMGDFDIEDIKIKVSSSFGDFYVTITEDMLSNEEKEALNTIGVHNFDVIYKEKTFDFTITINEKENDNPIDNKTYEVIYTKGQTYEAGTFNIEDIQIKVSENSTSKTYTLNDSFLTSSVKEELNTVGLHSFDIEYDGKDITISITITNKNEDEENYTTISIKEAVEIGEELGSAKSDKMYSVTGKIDIVENTTFGNMVISNDGSSINIYGMYSDDKHTLRYDAFDYQPKENDTITVYGYIQKYSQGTTTKIEIVDAVLLSYIEAEEGTKPSEFDMAYYANANGKYGNELKLALRSIISVTKKTETYNDLKSDLQKTDAATTKGKLVCFYSHKELNASWDGGSTWNREHVWPQSKGWFTTSGAGADIHHLRPASSALNSARGNTSYGTGSGYYTPNDNVKGDVARIIFYLMVRYSEADNYKVTKVAQSMSMLLDWNALDPVDDLERQRNNVGYSIQGNRNPFIDYSDYAYYIWDQSRLTNEVSVDIEPNYVIYEFNEVAYIECKWFV